MSTVMDAERLLKRFGHVQVSHILNVWLKVKEGFNLYLNQMDFRSRWECEDVHVPFQKIEDAPLIMLLSATNHPTDGDDCHDYLFIVINDIIERYNAHVMKLNSIHGFETNANELNPSFLFRESQGELLPLWDFDEDNDFLRLISERYWMPDQQAFYLDKLYASISEKLGYSISFPSAKPIISNPLNFLRERFQFYEKTNTKDACKTDVSFFVSSFGCVFVHAHDLQLFEETLKEAYVLFATGEKDNDTDVVNSLVTLFHTADYMQLRSCLEGSRTLLSMIKEEKDFENVVQIENGSVLPKIFSLNEKQLNLIKSFNGQDIIDFIHFLGYQISTEAYLYSRLPVSLASPLENNLLSTIESRLLEMSCKSGNQKALNAIQEFTRDVLMFYEQEIRKEQTDKSLKIYLNESNFCDESDPIFLILPVEVKLKHFISLNQILHQVKLKLNLKISSSDKAIVKSDEESKSHVTGDDTSDLAFLGSMWNENLLHPTLSEETDSLWYEKNAVNPLSDIKGSQETSGKVSQDHNTSILLAASHIQKWWRQKKGNLLAT